MMRHCRPPFTPSGPMVVSALRLCDSSRYAHPALLVSSMEGYTKAINGTGCSFVAALVFALFPVKRERARVTQDPPSRGPFVLRVKLSAQDSIPPKGGI